MKSPEFSNQYDRGREDEEGEGFGIRAVIISVALWVMFGAIVGGVWWWLVHR